MSCQLRVDRLPASHCATPTERPDHMMTVKVGCLHINPSTARGRRLYVMQMMLLCFIPHAALIAQNCTIMAQLSAALDSSWYLYSEVTEILRLGEAIMAVQDERHDVGSHIFEREHAEADTKKLLHTYTLTNEHMEGFQSALLADGLRMTLYHLREDASGDTYSPTCFGFIRNPSSRSLPAAKEAANSADRAISDTLTYVRGRDSYKRMAVYDDIGDICLLSLEKQVKSTTSSLWRQLSVCLELVRAREQLSRAHLDLQYLRSLELVPNASQPKQPDPGAVSQLIRHLESGVEHLDALVQYMKADELEIDEVKGVIDYYKTSLRFNETSKLAEIRSKGQVFTKESKACLDKLRRFQYGFRSIVRISVQQEVWAARRTLGVGIAVLVIVLVVSPVLILLLKNTISTMQSFSTSIASTTQRLMAEKQKSDILLSRMLPMPVLQRLRAQKTVPAEAFDAVTIFFSDIVGFTSISAKSTPMEIINMLNMLYRLFDEKITQYNVYKVETIGDAYMAVSGLPQRNGNRHASEIADMSLSLIRSLDGATVPHCPGEALRIRAGINTGPCVAGVVGTSMPRYCLFGDTINTASRMESTGEAMKIHMSDTTKKALDVIGGYQVESRGITEIPGKGEMETFWLIGKMSGIQHESPVGPCLKDYDQEFLEMLIS